MHDCPSPGEAHHNLAANIMLISSAIMDDALHFANPFMILQSRWRVHINLRAPALRAGCNNLLMFASTTIHVVNARYSVDRHWAACMCRCSSCSLTHDIHFKKEHSRPRPVPNAKCLLRPQNEEDHDAYHRHKMYDHLGRPGERVCLAGHQPVLFTTQAVT